MSSIVIDIRLDQRRITCTCAWYDASINDVVSVKAGKGEEGLSNLMSKDMNNLKPEANVEAAAYASLTRAYCHESEPILRANPSLLKDDSVRTIAGEAKGDECQTNIAPAWAIWMFDFQRS